MKAYLPQDLGIDRHHYRCGEGDGSDPASLPAYVGGEDKEADHDGRPHHRWRHPGEHGIAPQGAKGHQEIRWSPPAEEPYRNAEQDAGDNGHVKPGDGEEVGRP